MNEKIEEGMLPEGTQIITDSEESMPTKQDEETKSPILDVFKQEK